MQIYLSSISGWDDAILTLFMSRGTWTPELDREIHDVCDKVLTRRGLIKPEDSLIPDLEYMEMKAKFDKWTNSLFKYGQKHITMLKFLDFCFVVKGLHRAATDDWDAHAERYNNRIIRLSTRVNAMKNVDESTKDIPLSGYYKDKVLTLGQAAKIFGIDFPEKIENNGETYVRGINGYVREDLKDDPNVTRGLYPLGLDNLFVFKCNFTEYAHVRDLRSGPKEGNPMRGHAHPEIWDLCTMIDEEIFKLHPLLNEDYFDNIKQ